MVMACSYLVLNLCIPRSRNMVAGNLYQGWRLTTIHKTAERESQSPRRQKEDASTEMGIEVIPKDVWGAEK